MTQPSGSTHQRIIQAALELFVAQGVSGTTTRQIADAASVNEVTLFRQFGNKQGLLLAVLQESEALQQLGVTLISQANPADSVDQMLKQYASYYLHALGQVPEFLRSLIGEASQQSPDNRQALGQVIERANQTIAEYLSTTLEDLNQPATMPTPVLAALLNSLLLGYGLIELTSDAPLWPDQEIFLEHLINMLLYGAITKTGQSSALSLTHPLPTPTTTIKVQDLAAPVVHQIMRQAKKSNPQDYALAYLLFASGLNPTEIAILDRSAHVSNSHQHLLAVTAATGERQVPINQWVMGKRYGSYTANPLTKWLKSRKDRQPQLFLNVMDQPITATDIEVQWQMWTEDLVEGPPLQLYQAQHTWMIDMLLRGISTEHLSILTGQDIDDLRPYLKRAQQLAALDEAKRLDQKPGSPRGTDTP